MFRARIKNQPTVPYVEMQLELVKRILHYRDTKLDAKVAERLSVVILSRGIGVSGASEEILKQVKTEVVDTFLFETLADRFNVRIAKSVMREGGLVIVLMGWIPKIPKSDLEIGEDILR